MVKVCKHDEFVNICANIEVAANFIKNNNYKIYTIYCGKDIIVIEVV